MFEPFHSLLESLRLASQRLLPALAWSVVWLAGRCTRWRGAGARQPIDKPGRTQGPGCAYRHSSTRRTSCASKVRRDVASLGGAERGAAMGRWDSENRMLIGLNCSSNDARLLVAGLRPDFSLSAAIRCMRMARRWDCWIRGLCKCVGSPSKGATIWRSENAR